MANTLIDDGNTGRQLRLLAIIFGAFFALLIGGYFLFLRMNYSLLYQDLPITDASAIVAELEAKEIKFRLRNGGRDILVPAVDADAIRLGVVESEAPSRRLDGFELFNDSEMGLTEFAQKVKFQRALQGELARTIMLIDGVENARVHIAMPERALFRGESSQATAAVTLVTRSGQFDEEARVLGIQRLVAASVPDLELDAVTVLNSDGEVISAVQTPASTVLTQYMQIAAAYKEQIDIALTIDAPDLEYDLKVAARPLNIATLQVDDGLDKTSNAPRIQPKSDYLLRVMLTTDEALSEQERMRVANLISEAAQIDLQQGDQISFNVRELPRNLSLASMKPAAVSGSETSLAANDPLSSSFLPVGVSKFALLLGALAFGGISIIGVSSIIISRRRRNILTTEEHIEFAKKLRLQLHDAERAS